jgi:hypothetical protein
VNNRIHKTRPYMKDINQFGAEDIISLSSKRIDCEEAAIIKFLELLRKGFDRGTMRLGIVEGAEERHMVLILRTKRDGKAIDLVLDNDNTIKTVAESGYRFWGITVAGDFMRARRVVESLPGDYFDLYDPAWSSTTAAEVERLMALSRAATAKSIPALKRP